MAPDILDNSQCQLQAGSCGKEGFTFEHRTTCGVGFNQLQTDRERKREREIEREREKERKRERERESGWREGEGKEGGSALHEPQHPDLGSLTSETPSEMPSEQATHDLPKCLKTASCDCGE